MLQSLPTSLPWKANGKGEITDAVSPQSMSLTTEQFRQDAERFALAFGRDARALHGHNHDHNCSFTCIKYVTQKAKQNAEQSLNTGMNSVCRFFCYVVLVGGLAVHMEHPNLGNQSSPASTCLATPASSASPARTSRNRCRKAGQCRWHSSLDSCVSIKPKHEPK